MSYALRLGRRALGTTAENPNVGCVIVRDGKVLGIGWTQPGGRPHAETVALDMAGEGARGATAYVTLEPCAHHGRTPPCAEAGIEVVTGIGADDARRDLAGFLMRIAGRRPQVILKLAVSADGKISASVGNRTAITGEAVRARVHLLRAQCNAILVGMGTVLVDDPELTCRLPGLENRSPRPFVLSRGRDLPPGSKLAQAGATVLRGSVTEAVGELGRQGINRLLVEGGAMTARSFLDAGVVDEVQIFRSPDCVGAGGVDALAGLDLEPADRL